MEFLEVLYAIILGVIEGITEWLPISSTGHLILAKDILIPAWGLSNISDEFMEMFLVVIQLGAIMAIVVLFFKRLNPFFIKKEESKKRFILWSKVLVACLPAAVIGLLFDDWLDNIFYNPLTVSITLIVYGIIFILIEMFFKRTSKVNDVAEITFKMALIIGLIQLLALIPGTSRSGVTILGALLLSFNRKTAAEFSFFISIPVMVGASLLKVIKFGSITQNELLLLLISSLVAFVVSIAIIRFLLNYIKKHDFKIFGYYRIVLGIIFIILIVTQVI